MTVTKERIRQITEVQLRLGETVHHEHFEVV